MLLTIKQHLEEVLKNNIKKHADIIGRLNVNTANEF